MKKYQHLIFIAVLVAVLLFCMIPIFVFEIKDMTIAQGQVYDFNDGWELTRPDGTKIQIDRLPYNEKSNPGEVYTLSKTIDALCAGKTLRFLSADKTLSVSLDGNVIYEFGVSDVRMFGHTPGSITNFVNIPDDIGSGRLEISMASPYADYASNICDIVIGDADVLELTLIKDNLFNYFICMIILFSALLLIILEIIEFVSTKEFTGTIYLGEICLFGAVYHAIETKSLNIFYGNQTLYSIFVFIFIMTVPSFLCLYYICNINEKYKKRFEINFFLCVLNICFQLIAQGLDLADFMVIAPISHVIIAITVINVDVAIVQSVLEERKLMGYVNYSQIFELIGITSILVGSFVDIIRFYVTPVGDMGKYGRLGMLIFSIITLTIHIHGISQRYIDQVNENMRLMEEHLREAKRASMSKSSFLANMSHEIRTPMNSITGFAEILLKQDLNDLQSEYVENIRESSYNLLSIINDILDISKIESGKIEIVESEFDVAKMLKSVCNQIKALAEKKGLVFKTDISSDIPKILFGDEIRIREILINILNNAVKYTNEGSVTLTVNLENKFDDIANLIIKSTDTGIGISDEGKSIIFHAFEQVDKKKNHGIEGTGLGLSIVRSYIELMHGSVDVESTVGEGSTFTIMIPLGVRSDESIGEFEYELERREKIKSRISDIKIDNKKALVVDDSIVNLKVIGKTLEHYGIEVRTANNAKKGIELCKENSFNYIFMDQMMPVMDGVEAMHIIRQLSGYEMGSRNKIYVLTANAIKGVEEELLAEGFDAYLKKPIEFDKLEKLLLEDE